jgi:single-stranded DNA-binding protein
MFWIENAFIKVWSIDSKEKYDDLRISTSEKSRTEEGKFINSNWFARAIGHAHEQIAAGYIHEGNRAKIAKGKVTNETYTDNEGNKKSSLRVVIMEFAVDEKNEPAPKAEPKANTKKKSAPKKTKAQDKKKPGLE